METTSYPRLNRFTMVELLVIITIICIFSTILLPLFHHISLRTRALECIDSLFQLNRSTILYAEEYGCYSPGAVGEYMRWHGKKASTGNYAKIDFSKGFLYPYIDDNENFKGCPEMQTFIRDPNGPAYEKGGFGFGYNLNIGSLRAISDIDQWEKRCQQSGITRRDILNPKETVIFADTACKVNHVGESSINGDIAENCFAKSFYLINKKRTVGGLNDPTVHFRHGGQANAAWADGHISQETMKCSKGDWGEANIGYIGSMDKTFFEPNPEIINKKEEEAETE